MSTKLDLKTKLYEELTTRLEKIRIFREEAEALFRTLKILGHGIPIAVVDALRKAGEYDLPTATHTPTNSTASSFAETVSISTASPAENAGGEGGGTARPITGPSAPKAIQCEKHQDNQEFNKHGRCRPCLRESANASYDRDKPEKRLKEKKCAKCKELKPAAKFKMGWKKPKRVCVDCEMEVPAIETAVPNENDVPIVVVLADPAVRSENEAVEQLTAPTAPQPEPVSEREFVYSRPVKCPKCGAEHVRLRRLKDADLAKDCWLHVHDDKNERPCTIKIAHYIIKQDSAYQPRASGHF